MKKILHVFSVICAVIITACFPLWTWGYSWNALIDIANTPQLSENSNLIPEEILKAFNITSQEIRTWAEQRIAICVALFVFLLFLFNTIICAFYKTEKKEAKFKGINIIPSKTIKTTTQQATNNAITETSNVTESSENENKGGNT